MPETYMTDCDCYLGEIKPIDGIYIPTATDLFGSTSTLVPPPDGGVIAQFIESSHLTDSYMYQGIVLGVFMLFCYLIHNYRSSIITVFKVLSGQLSTEKVFEEYPLFFRYFLGRITLLGILLFTGLIIRYGDMYHLCERLPQQMPMVGELFGMAVSMAAILVVCYRYFITRIIGNVIQNELFFENLRFSTRIISAFICLVLTPLFLVVALTDSGGIDTLLLITALLAGVLYLLHLTKSYRFFMSRDVSILQWILYLCAVEFFPISFFALLVVRNG